MLLNRNRRFPRIPFAAAFAAAGRLRIRPRLRLRLRPRTRPGAALAAPAAPAALALAFLLGAAVLLAGMLAGPTPPAAADQTLTADSVTITSTPAAEDDYHAGETITARVTFSQAITAHTGATLTFAIGLNNRVATLEDATGLNTTTLDFSYVVTSFDQDGTGIAIAANAIAGTYEHSGHAAPDHSITTIGTPLTTAQTAHKVNTTATVDYDTDNDGLIEVDSLAKLDAIRYNLTGDGDPTGRDAASHAAAFPRPAPAHGCPDTDDVDSVPGPCTGYELTANLDFDTDGDGSTYYQNPGQVIYASHISPDTGDEYPSDGGAILGWRPIGSDGGAMAAPFAGIFEGNGHAISNLLVAWDTATAGEANFAGLFADLSGEARNLRLVNPLVRILRVAAGANDTARAGALAGRNRAGGTVSGVVVAGGYVIGNQFTVAASPVTNLAGCLLGSNAGAVRDSAASCTARALGGDDATDQAGGLIARNSGAVSGSYATGRATADRHAGGLIGDNAAGGTVTSSGASGAVAVSDAGGAAGGLVGRASGANTAITASYATGAVSAAGGNVAVGGLVGEVGAGVSIRAVWAGGAATASGAGASNRAGGLVGEVAGTGASIRASYARGAVSASGGTANHAGGLAGNVGSGATVSDSHWDSGTTGQASGAGDGAVATTATAKTASQLQSPTTYGASAGDTYHGWNLDLDGQTGGDDPWHFGANDAYPVLKFGHQAPGFALQFGHTPVSSYDRDGDRLIEVGSLAQLDAIRYDLDGDGPGSSLATADAIKYARAFPGLTWGMGCAGACIGYELAADLDFDTNGSGGTHTAGVGDNDDDYYKGGVGWTPIGGSGESTHAAYSAVFEGNGRTIANLFIKRSSNAAADDTYVGLFADLRGTVRNVGLVDPYVENTRSGAASGGFVRTGALAGRTFGDGAVRGSYVAGGVVRSVQNTPGGSAIINLAGGLLGYNAASAAVSSSWASCTVTATGSADAVDRAGGLIGFSQGPVSGSHATGRVTSDGSAGGLIGHSQGAAVTASYATGAAIATGDGGRAGGLVGLAGGVNTAITGSYATGAATASGGNASAGGLVGKAGQNVAIRAVYATGAATASGNGTNSYAGGLVGHMDSRSSSVTASYARGAVSASGGSGNNYVGGLVGRGTGDNEVTVTDSHWDSETTGQADSAGFVNRGGKGSAKTTAELQSPTDYGASAGDTFYGWNIDLDDVTGNDDPWHFGTSDDYPILQFGHHASSISAQLGHAPVSSYDTDRDNLIAVGSLAQLNAIRYDLAGNGPGELSGADAVRYARAFPGLPRGMGCPAGCIGYELAADLDFDTDGDGATYTVADGTATVDAEDTGNFFNGAAGWVPIGDGTTGYSGVFEGNRRAIDHLYINIPASDTTLDRIGLFGTLESGGVIRGVGITRAYVRRVSAAAFYAGALVGESSGTVIASHATGGRVAGTRTGAGTGARVGGLVGQIGSGGAVSASYANAAVALSSDDGRVGGLVGRSVGGRIVASYAAGSVTLSDSNSAYAGGLAAASDNDLDGDRIIRRGTIDSSYARGRVGYTGSVTQSSLAGLVAYTAPNRVTNSRWDRFTTEQQAQIGGGAPQTTAALQTPTGYTGIYGSWNVDVDGDGTNDDPWEFGTASQYPILKYGGFSPVAQDGSYTGTDYDSDDDGLIDIDSLAKLDAVRYDLDGDGRPARIQDYLAAFPGGEVGSDGEVGTAGRMGCAYDHDNDAETALRTACLGYELLGSLDFDTDGDNDGTHAGGVGDAGDDYYNAGAGWEPIGSFDALYTGEFNGRGYVIDNLYVARSRGYSGLFAGLGSTGKIIGVGLNNPRVTQGQGAVGTLAGLNGGLVAASYSRGGSVSAQNTTGGLVGANGDAGRIVASYATTAVACGGSQGSGAGLVSGPGGGVTASYAIGAVTGACANKAGLTNGNDNVVASYWNSGTTTPSGGNPGGASRTTAQLRAAICYTGDFAGWNVDLDGDGAGDEPWYFSGGSDYPALQYGGHSLAGQGIANRLAELTGLGIAPGQIYDDLLHCGGEYEAVVGPAVAEITVSPTATTGTPTYQDADDATLADSNAAAGHQAALSAGENTVKVSLGAGRSYVLKVQRAAVPTVTGTTQKSATWTTRNGSLDTAQLLGSTRAAQTLTFTVDDSGGETPTASEYWATMQVWLCTTQAVDNTRPTAAAGCVNAGIMSNPTPDDAADDNEARVAATVAAAQARNGGVVVKVWDTTAPGALQLAQWLPIRLADDSALTALSIAGGGEMRPPFAPASHRYTYYRAAGDTQLTVTHTANHPSATVAYQDGDGNTLTDGDTGTDGFQIPVGTANGAVTEFAVVVTAADGTTAQRYTVAVTANTPPGLVINPSPLVVRDGGTGSYTVALDTQPSAGVTVSISRQARTGGAAAEAEIRVGSAGNFGTTASLSFTDSNWNTPQAVSVRTPAADSDANDEADTFRHAVAAGSAPQYRGTTADLTVNIKEPGIILSETGALAVTEEASAAVTYTVKLTAPPSAQVTVTVSGDAGASEVQFSTTEAGAYATTLALTFDASNWDTAQTVYVKAVNDADAADDSGNITHTIASNAGGYTTGVTASRMVTVTDDDATRAVTEPAPKLVMAEGDATYTVKLSRLPGNPVTVTIARKSGGDNEVEFHTGGTGATYSATSKTLNFTTTNWNDAQTVYVRANDTEDAIETDTLTHTLSGLDANFGDPVELEVEVRQVGITLSETDLTVAEGGSAVTYTVQLAAPPAAAVTVTVDPDSDLGDVEVSNDGQEANYGATTTLSFDADNWNAAQTVYVKAGDDDDADNDAGNIDHTAGASGGYTASVTAALATTVTDDDTRALDINPATTLNMEEGDATYTVRLATQPSADVEVAITRKTDAQLSGAILFGSDGSTYAATSITLTFTSGDWNSDQTVYVRAPADADNDDERDVLTHGISSTGDSGYNGLSDVELTVNVQERSVLLNPATALALNEGGDASSYTVKLSHQPSAAVSVAVASTNADLEFSIDGGTAYAATQSLSFTGGSSGNWNTDQTVHVRAKEDDDGDDDTATITHTPSGGGYSVVRSRTVNIADDDTRGLVIAPSPLEMREGDTATYTVRLATQPRGDVTVTIARKATGGDDKVEFSIDSGTSYHTTTGQDLTFTDSNWDTTQTVTVRATAELDNADETDVLIHDISSTADTDYNGLSDVELTVTARERSVLLDPSGTLALNEEGDAVSYTVALSRQPSGPVTVAIASAGSDLEFSIDGGSSYAATRSLSFSSSSGVSGGWDRPQTVHVRAGHDADGREDTATITHTPSGGGYSIVRSREVTITDDDLGLVLTGLGAGNTLTVTEGGTGTFTVRLGSEPVVSVTVAITRDSGAQHSTDITLDTGGDDTFAASETLTFGASATNDAVLWSEAQTVTVRAAADSDSDDDTASLTFSLTSDYDTDYAGLAQDDVMVTVTDSIIAGLTVSPRTLSATAGSASTRTYTIRLKTPPSDDVTVTPVVSGNPGVTIQSPTTLTFTDDNWSDEQTVTVAVAASAAAGTPATVTHTLVSTDSNYDGRGQDFASDGDVTVNITAPAGGGGFGGFGGGGGNTFGGGGAAAAAPAASPPDIEFSADSVAVDEGGAAAYRVRLSAEPTGAATVTITSSNSDVTATPASLDFTDAWDQWQTVLVTAARDRNTLDATARLTHRGPEGSRGVLPVSVADTWPEAVTRTVNGNTLTVTYTQDAPPGVTAEAPATLAADAAVAVSVAPEDTPPTPLAYGRGEGAATPAHISVSGTGTDGLTICLPAVAAATAAAASVAEGEEPPPPTLLRYTGTAADGSWQPVANAQVVADADTGLTTVCAAGVTGEGVYAAAYPLPLLGTIADFTATPGADPGTVTLNWQAADHATHHFIAGVSRADLDAGRFVFAIWNWSEEPDSHTYTDLDSGVLYYITAIAGRYFEARDQTQWSAWVNWQLVTPN